MLSNGRARRAIVNVRRLLVGTLVHVLLVGCGGAAKQSSSSSTASASAKAPNEIVLNRKAAWNAQIYDGMILRFVGNEHATAMELATDLAIPHGMLEDDVLDRDALVVSAWYYDHGYLEVKVERPRVTVLPGGHEVLVEVAISEGSQYRIRSLHAFEEIDGKKVAPLGWSTKLKPGDLFSRRSLIDSLSDLRTSYRDRGYAYVEADPVTDLDKKKKEVGIEIPVRRGILTHFGHIRFSGNATTTTATLEKHISVTQGMLYTETGLVKSKERLLATGWFTRVDVSTKKGDKEDLVDVSFEFDERPSNVPVMTAILVRGSRP